MQPLPFVIIIFSESVGWRWNRGDTIPAMRDSEFIIFGRGIGFLKTGFTGTGGKHGLRGGSALKFGDAGFNTTGGNIFCGVVS